MPPPERVLRFGRADHRRAGHRYPGPYRWQLLEDSNVDLTGELVNLIKAQSNYQANAKTISTESTIMQTIIQMT